MRFVLLYLKTHGLKSLERDVEIQFYKKNLSDFDFNKALVKAIYGTNGEGKTALAHTMDLYKNTIINPDYLPAQNLGGHLKSLINKKTQSVLIDLYFAVIKKEGQKRIYHHVINYVLKDGRLVISHEAIKLCRGLVWGRPDKEISIVETQDGDIIKFYRKDLEEEIKKKTANLLSSYSVVFPFFNFTFEYLEKKTSQEEAVTLLGNSIPVVCFALLLSVFIDKEDKYVMDKEYLESIKTKLGKTNYVPPMPLVGDSDDTINPKDDAVYKNEIKRIEALLKVFKPNLKEILIKQISKTETQIIYKKVLMYSNDDEIDLECESTGIKKLFRLFTYLGNVEYGGVAFIDEFDANIHDVYLCKLVEYFAEYTNGQLIFTTHNLGPMEVLDKADKKYSIDFINNQTVSSWRKNGNYSVVRVYRSGSIPNSPFNINAVDFVKVFVRGKKNAK